MVKKSTKATTSAKAKKSGGRNKKGAAGRAPTRAIPSNANVREGADVSVVHADEVGFAGYPMVVMWDAPGTGKKAVNQLLWGDWLVCKRNARRTDGWVEIRARGSQGWVKEKEIQRKRLLEIVFVDIGQGDGALVVTPDDKHILIDAGERDNMIRFLRWKYGKFAKPWRFEAVVISHPDQDHYKGFQPLFETENVNIGTVYHNGLVERVGDKALGQEKRVDGATYVMDVVRDKESLAGLLASDAARGRKIYPKLLKTALDSRRVEDIRSLSAADKHLPGFGPNDGEVKIEVLGPVTEDGPDGTTMLRRFDSSTSYGKTKNGHSVVLRLTYGNRTVLLGGDLNIPAEEHLLRHHTKQAVPPKTKAAEDQLVQAAQRKFRCDVAKACHHGSADFSSIYLRAVDPLVTVISSGDDEPHAHPRADALGAVGRWGRGTRPLVFSTELARSAKEAITNPKLLQQRLQEAETRLEKVKAGPARRKAEAALEKVRKEVLGKLDRSIAVYGAINLRTDGKRLIMAQRIERQRGKKKKWDIYMLEEGKNGTLRFVSKHEEPTLV